MEPDLSDPRGGDPDVEERRIRALVVARMFERGEPGFKIARFTVLDRLGRGGMGDVYAAYDPQLDRKVALKLLHRLGSDERVLREARTMASINHPNVAQIFEVGVSEERVFIAMEFVQGHTLRSWLAAGERSWRDVLAMYRQAGCGLVAAHSAGIVHRDFKPENVLVGDDGRVRVVDFGLSRETFVAQTVEPGSTASPIDGTLTGSLAGTPAYMAPEQFRGRDVDARADQFAFCVALHEALHGERPYFGETRDALFAAVERGEVHVARSAPTLPVWVIRPVRRGLEPDSGARHASMQALLDELDRDPTRRRRAFFSVGAILLAGVGAIGWQKADRAHAASECAAEGDATALTWNPERAASLATAFTEANATYGEGTWTRAEPILAAWADRWAADSTRVCTEANIDHTRTPELLDAARECLAEQHAQFEALLEQFGDPRDGILWRAVSSARGLPRAEVCTDERQLLQRVRPPPDEATHAEVRALRSELARVTALRSTARYPEALRAAEGILERAESLAWAPLLAEAQQAFGLAQRDIGDFAAARATMEKAWFTAGASGHDRTAMSAATALVGVVGVRLAKQDEGLRWHEMARMFAARLGLDDDSPDLATVLVDVGSLHLHRGAYDEALPALERALEINERVLGLDHPSVARCLDTIGNVHHSRGAKDEAMAAYTRALEIRERTLGPDHPEVGTSYNNIGLAYRKRGALAEALEAHGRALDIRTRTLGAEHADVAGSLTNLGNVYVQMAAYNEALTSFERAVAVQRKALGPAHPDVAMSLKGISNVHFRRGDYDQALAAGEQALAVVEKTLGPEHGDVAMALVNVSNAQQARGDVDHAIAALERAVTVSEKALGPDHPQVALCLSNLGALHRRRGELEKGRSMLERALAIREKKLGPTHDDVAASLVNLANVDRELRDYEKALAGLQRALSIYEQSLGPRHPLVATTLFNIGRVHEGREAYGDAIEAQERALEIRESAEVPTEDVAQVRFALASALWAKGSERARARELAERARKTLASLGASQSESLAEIDGWLREHRGTSAGR